MIAALSMKKASCVLNKIYLYLWTQNTFDYVIRKNKWHIYNTCILHYFQFVNHNNVSCIHKHSNINFVIIDFIY